jgi:hypothetical protein
MQHSEKLRISRYSASAHILPPKKHYFRLAIFGGWNMVFFTNKQMLQKANPKRAKRSALDRECCGALPEKLLLFIRSFNTFMGDAWTKCLQ